MTAKFYLVGGAVRDRLMGLRTKDLDFAVSIEPEGRDIDQLYRAMRDELDWRGFEIHTETPDKFVIRARVCKTDLLYKVARDADFVLCRKDGPYTDGRRPDWVEPGTLFDDLARRDFTVNAMAEHPFTHKIIDPFGGQRDLENKILRFVGNPEERIIEDGLRVVRGFRFMISKGLTADPLTWSFLNSDIAAKALSIISIERVDQEISRMFQADTKASIHLMASITPNVLGQIFRDRLHLTGSLKNVKE